MTGRVTLSGPDLMALSYICRNLRDRDREEVLVGAASTPDELAAATWRCGSFQWLAWLDAKPVAVIGAAPLWPGHWTAFAFGTEDWPAVVRTLTKHAKRVMGPTLYDAGLHRLSAASLDKHTEAHAWLERLGAHREGTLHGYGRDGQNFVQFAWRR